MKCEFIDIAFHKCEVIVPEKDEKCCAKKKNDNTKLACVECEVRYFAFVECEVRYLAFVKCEVRYLAFHKCEILSLKPNSNMSRTPQKLEVTFSSPLLR